MLNIYRLTRYPDHDYIIFQADNDFKEEFRKRFRVKITRAKRGFENSWFTFLRDDYRNLFDLIKEYFKENYSPPELLLSCYKANRPLSDTWPADIWQKKVEEAISSEFSRAGYFTQSDKYSGMVTVTPPEPNLKLDNIDIYWSVKYRVEINPDQYPYLWCIDCFKFFMEDRPTNLETIARVYGQDSDIIRDVKSYTTRNAKDEFSKFKGFVKTIPQLEQCENIKFDNKPEIPESLGFKTWYWNHDSSAYFEASKGLKTNLTQVILDEECGFYHQPDDISVIVLTPKSEEILQIPQIDWQQVGKDIKSFLNRIINNVNVPFIHEEYCLHDDIITLIKRLKIFISQNDNTRLLCILFAPPSDLSQRTTEISNSIEDKTKEIYKEIKNLSRGGYIETIDWGNMKSEKDSIFIINNTVFSGLIKMGAIPWIIKDLPFENIHNSENYFLGLSVNNSSEIFAGSAILMSNNSNLVAFAGIYLTKEEELVYSSYFFQEMINDLIMNGIHHSQPDISHIIVHMGHELIDYRENISEIQNQISISFDLVQINESHIRFKQPYNVQSTPSHGIAIGDEHKNIAYLMNTLSYTEITNRGNIYPNPNTLSVKKISGSTSLKSLAAQVYWLSSGNTYSLHRTIDKPMTLIFSDALLAHIQKTKKPMSVKRNYKRTLYWL